LRELLLLRSGDVVGGGGDDLDVAARVAAAHREELDLVRRDLAAAVEMIKVLSAQVDHANVRIAGRRDVSPRRFAARVYSTLRRTAKSAHAATDSLHTRRAGRSSQ
jgi:hypothetical protein